MAFFLKTPIVQEFLKRIDPNIFSKIVYRIAQNPNHNRAGVSDFVVWNDDSLTMIEVKKIREKIRESQLEWLNWMVEESIPVRIVRLRAV